MDSTTILLGGTAALGATVSFIFGLLLKSWNDRLKEKDDQLSSYKSISTAALFAADEAIKQLAICTGKPIPAMLAPVIAEHASPITPRAARRADIATDRARVVAQYVWLGIDPVKVTDAVAQVGDVLKSEH